MYNARVRAEAALTDPEGTALYLFPTKALARDQLRQVRALKLPQLKAAVYDGDTPQAERPLIRKNANLVMTNPDMLHAVAPARSRPVGRLLPPPVASWWWTRRTCVRGVFGSHVAMVLRRLRRLVAHYGGDPRWCLASATVGNPVELADASHRPGRSTRSSRTPRPRGEKLFALWNPPIAGRGDRARAGAR